MRLTEKCWRNLDPWECCGQDKYCQRGCHDEGGCTNGCKVPKMYCKLAKYEDAEEQGLLLRLPCKVGDTVFLVQYGKMYERKVNGFSITSNNRLVIHMPDFEMDNATFPAEQFGKTIFLSRESALAEKGGAE